VEMNCAISEEIGHLNYSYSLPTVVNDGEISYHDEMAMRFRCFTNFFKIICIILQLDMHNLDNHNLDLHPIHLHHHLSTAMN
jgi:hypothetical protein